ncbi:hypothetical protein FIM12_01085 [SAR202 cluster bacterium AD-804-J14_MRT_500m]|nr:hypothetical protein [SAR202 cluster bacterium AD-804-J14_MRT_500m]
MIILAISLLVFMVVTPQGKTTFHTILFVAEVLELPVKAQSWFTDQPIRREISYPIPNGKGLADVYRLPDSKPRAAVLLFLGANAAGRDDRSVVSLGNALSRAGMVTMFHWSDTMALENNIDPQEIENLVWAFKHLQLQPYVDPERVGLGGFCVGASFALIAASDTRIASGVSFVNAFGPYYNAEDLLIQAASRTRYYQNSVEPWNPDRLTLAVLANEITKVIAESDDRRLLNSVFVQGEQPSEQDISGLSKQGLIAYNLLRGVSSRDEARELFLELPKQFHDELATVSPKSHIANLSSTVLILHDRDDKLVPSAESRRLFDNLSESGKEVRYTELMTFDHVRPTTGAGIKELGFEGYKLFKHMYSILRIAH